MRVERAESRIFFVFSTSVVYVEVIMSSRVLVVG